MHNIFNKTALLVAALSFAGAAQAQAQWNTQNFNVTANVGPGCLIAVNTHMAFGTLDVITQTDATSQATFDVTCTNGLGAVSLTFVSANGNISAPASTFKMVNTAGTTPATQIVYELYQADTSTLIAYNTVTPFTELVADGTIKTLTINGKIAAAAKTGALAGAYTDVVTMTATYPAQ